jgi:hypothetical protein
MNPEGYKGCPTSESMHNFKSIVESYAKPRVSTAQDGAEHHDKDIRSYNVRDLVTVMRLCEFLGGKGRIQQIPCDRSYTGATMDSSVVKYESQLGPNEERSRMRNTGGDLVKEVHKILLAEENGDHEISGGGISDITSLWSTSITGYE